MTTIEKLITPALAEVYLKRNKSNRKVTQPHVEWLANQMLNGQYKENTGESIKFSKSGLLIDGQHRLLAIIRSGRSFKFTINEDLDDDVFQVLDTGNKRTSSDVLSIKGVHDSNTIATTVRYILDITSGKYATKTVPKHPNEVILKYIEKHPDLQDVVKNCKVYYKTFRPLPPSVLSAVCYILMEKGHPEATINNFLEKYSNGIGIPEDSPIYQLRMRFINDSMNKTKLKLYDKVYLFIYAWNLYIKGRTTNRLTIPDQFPTLI